jgi:hypothetical protein
MLYQALSGQLPYLGTPYQVLLGKQTEAPPPIATLNPQAPADLVALAMELLAINPKERPLGRDVLRRLGTAVHALPPPAYGRGAVAARAPLYGRSEHLAALRGAFVAAKDQPVVVHLSGAPGMGKTALAQHFLAELEREGSAIVLAGRCFEAEQLAFKAVDHLIDSLSRSLRRLSLVELEALLPPDVVALAQLFPVLERVDVIQQLVQEAPKKGYPRAAAFAALRNLFYQLARKRRVVCFLDDLQFGDQDSAELLTQLLAPPRPPPFLLIAAYPSSERDRQEILRVLRAPKNSAFVVREILVGALSQAAAEELARSVLKEHGDPSEDDERPGEQIRTTMPAFPPAELRARARAIAREAEGPPTFCPRDGARRQTRAAGRTRTRAELHSPGLAPSLCGGGAAGQATPRDPGGGWAPAPPGRPTRGRVGGQGRGDHPPAGDLAFGPSPPRGLGGRPGV